MSDIKVGDTVRVTFEDVVVEADADGTLWFELKFDDGVNDTIVGYRPGDETTKTVELVKRAVTVFKPGDRLRRKGWTTLAYEVTLADEGYLQHHISGHVVYCRYGTYREWFNSENFDKIELHEAPL